MLAAYETGDIDSEFAERGERQQRQRMPLGVIGDNDERCGAYVRAGRALPGSQEIKALIRRMRDVAAFELAPGGFGLPEIGDDIDGRNASRLRPVGRLRGPAIERRGHGHLRHLSEIVY